MLKMQAIGHLGNDAVVNQTDGGKNVINFNVAHSEKFKDQQGNQKEKTTWVQCAYWTEKTGIAPYLKKGTQIWVEGSPEVKTYSKNDGTTGVSLTLRVSSVQLLSSSHSNDDQQPAQTQQQPAKQGNPNQAAIDKLPF